MPVSLTMTEQMALPRKAREVISALEAEVVLQADRAARAEAELKQVTLDREAMRAAATTAENHLQRIEEDASRIVEKCRTGRARAMAMRAA